MIAVIVWLWRHLFGEIAPPELPGPISEVGPGGDATVYHFPDGTPRPGAFDGTVQTGGTWRGALHWVLDQFGLDTSPAPATVDWPNMVTAIAQGVTRLWQVLASTSSALTDYFLSTTESLSTWIIGQANAAVVQLFEVEQFVETQMHEADAALYNGVVDAENQAVDYLHQAEQEINDSALGVLNYVYTTWVVPLQENIGQLYDAVNLESIGRAIGDAYILNQAIPDAIGQLYTDLLPLIEEGIIALPLAQRAVQFVDECGQEMCDTMGPNTDLGKLLKALQLSALLALLAEILGADFGDVEGAARAVAQAVGQAVDTVNTTFIEGGATIAQTLADLAGGVT